ncbi:hypothetical protein, partial [Bacillus pseudomycoides]
EYKAIYMIQDHLYLVYEAIQQDTQEVSKIFLRLFDLLQKNGRHPVAMAHTSSMFKVSFKF